MSDRACACGQPVAPKKAYRGPQRARCAECEKKRRAMHYQRRLRACACGNVVSPGSSGVCRPCRSKVTALKRLCSCGRRKSFASLMCVTCDSAARHSARIDRQSRSCEQCGTAFVKPRQSSTSGRFCSRPCAFAAKRQAAQNRRQQKQAVLAEASVVRAEVRAVREAARQAALEDKRQTAPIQATCSDCSAPIVRQKRRLAYRCRRCTRRQVNARQRALGRKHNGRHEQRAKAKGLPRDYSITPDKLFTRDGWRCQLCGRATPIKLKGLQHPSSPTIDHIIPIGLGGGHTWDNVQCACHACNQSKGAKPMGQLRLAV